MFLIDYIKYFIRFVLLHLFPYRFFIRKKSSLPPKRVVVSLTTIPDRIKKILPTLKSLTDQTMKPTQINLTVPRFSIRENKEYQIPEKLKNYPDLNILNCEKDWGPITKLIPTLQAEKEQSDTIIIIVDDDNIYPRNLVKSLVDESLKSPAASLGMCGCNLTEGGTWQYQGRGIKGNWITKEEKVDFVMGCGGILVKPSFFDQSFFDYEGAPEEAFYVDDIWINGHLAKNKISRFVIPLQGREPVFWPSLSTFFSLSLDQNENSLPGKNNKVINFFEKYW